jgi:hypothetical protein
MVLAGLFAGVLFLALVVGDWLQFTSLTVQAARYGCRIARVEEHLSQASLPDLLNQFGSNGLLQLSNGVARLFPVDRRLLLRPQRRFRTAWPMKGLIELRQEGETTTLVCSKLIPWSSAILTLLWFLTVGIGTLAFAILYLADGGLSSLSVILMGLGILGIGLLVLAFGLVTIALAYRLENHRFMQAYQDLLATLAEGRPSAS